jgi:ABC-type sugar transport system ATPase subunit
MPANTAHTAGGAIAGLRPPGAAPLLRVEHLTKTFPGLRALDDVSIEVGSGQVLAVVGQNGSGKSTLVKILAGVYEADPGGSIEVRGPEGTTVRGAEATRALHFIHQDLGLIPMLTTIENLDLDRKLGRRAVAPSPIREEERRARELIAQFGASFDVRVPISELTPTERTIVAIARALKGWTRPDNVLVLDEPTAALHGDEVGRLFAAVRSVAERGAGIIFISHRLDEVMDLADRVIALRDGKLVADVAAGEFDREALVQMIAGRQLVEARLERDTPAGRSMMTVEGLRGAEVRHVDLDLRSGEVLGVTGILGSGREDLCGLIFGRLPRERGTVRVDGETLAEARPVAAVALGVAYVPADRRADGAVMDMCVRENITLPRMRTLRRAFGRLDGRAERREVDDWVGRVGLRPPAPERPLKLFSGGNQQKVVLAKWLRIEPKVLLLDEPTQGVDVGAKTEIYELINQAAEQGTAVLVASSDTKELMRLCNRVIVLRDGVQTSELTGSELNEAQLVRESLGIRSEEAEQLFGKTGEDGS